MFAHAAQCVIAGFNREEAATALERVGLPAIIRPSFTLGGTGTWLAEGQGSRTRLALGVTLVHAGEQHFGVDKNEGGAHR